ncbi:MAG: RdgB/HAM1 family non-canonical purine NTP pyrophosphatase [Gallionella sp.]
MQKLVIASNNPGKLREFRFLLQPLGIEVLTQAQLGIEEAEEPHPTFIENALAKARHVSLLSGLPALADDSGICVTALDGAPGVLSARYAGDDPKSDQRNNEKLLQAMLGVTDRRAHYYCVLVLLRHAGDPQPLIAEGEWHGEIAPQPAGEGGFGYDPLFWLPQLGKTSAQLEREQKHAISHRGKALQVLLDKLKGGQYVITAG